MSKATIRYEKDLQDLLLRQGIVLDATVIQKYSTFALRLLQANEQVNLTAIRKMEDVFVRHFLDCLMPLKWGWRLPSGLCCDIGTGGGFPGLVYAILTENSCWTMVDSIMNKIKWIETIVMELELDHVIPLQSRAEKMGQEARYRESFDYCLTRAAAKGTVMLECCLPLVRIGGELWTWQGEDFEPKEWEDTLKVLGGSLETVMEYRLPGESSSKKFVVRILKVSPTPDRYPRRVGIPAKRPL